MGLDHSLYRRELDIKKRILATLDEEDSESGEELICWRKVYSIHNYMCVNYEVENCGRVVLDKDDLIRLLNFIESYIEELNDKKQYDEYWEKKDYVWWIEKLKEIIDETDFDKQEIYYWAWW